MARYVILQDNGTAYTDTGAVTNVTYYSDIGSALQAAESLVRTGLCTNLTVVEVKKYVRATAQVSDV